MSRENPTGATCVIKVGGAGRRCVSTQPAIASAPSSIAQLNAVARLQSNVFPTERNMVQRARLKLGASIVHMSRGDYSALSSLAFESGAYACEQIFRDERLHEKTNYPTLQRLGL